MILTGAAIRTLVYQQTDIIINPFNEKQLGANSYNARLHNELLVYDEVQLDSKADNRVKRIPIPDEGIVLRPGLFILDVLLNGRKRRATLFQ